LRIYVGDPKLMGPLLEYLDQHADCVWAQVGESEVEVSLLGSYRDEVHQAAIEQLVTGFRREGGPARRRAELRLVRETYAR
jgi:hypothetical protein